MSTRTGRVEGGHTWEYIYYARNRMTEVKKDTVTVALYLYDPEGNRIRATYPVDGLTTTYIFDVTGLSTENPIYEEDNTGGRRSYIYLNRKLLARVDGTIDTGDKYWFLTDHLGSARGITDDQGNLVWWVDYEAFGKVKASGGAGSVVEVPRFTGKAFDERVGLYYFNARWYDAGIGSFNTEDTFAGEAMDPLTQNRYAYCRSNPALYTDPTGHVFDYGTGGGGGGGGTPDDYHPEVEGSRPPVPNAPPMDDATRDKVETLYGEFAETHPNGTGITHESVTQFANEHGLTDAERLYLCELIAHNNPHFNKNFEGDPPNPTLVAAYGSDPNRPTWCNAYAEYVFWLFTGSTELMAAGADPNQNGSFQDPATVGVCGWTVDCASLDSTLQQKANSDDGWIEVAAEEAQQYANAGYYAVGVDSGHVAVVAPGEGVIRYDKNGNEVYFPAVAQQGSRNLLVGVTESMETMNWAWSLNDYSDVTFYVYIG